MDAHTYDHHHRALASRLPLATQWEAMSLPWLVDEPLASHAHGVWLIPTPSF
jgi:hypothetical protein